MAEVFFFQVPFSARDRSMEVTVFILVCPPSVLGGGWVGAVRWDREVPLVAGRSCWRRFLSVKRAVLRFEGKIGAVRLDEDVDHPG